MTTVLSARVAAAVPRLRRPRFSSPATRFPGAPHVPPGAVRVASEPARRRIAGGPRFFRGTARPRPGQLSRPGSGPGQHRERSQRAGTVSNRRGARYGGRPSATVPPGTGHGASSSGQHLPQAENHDLHLPRCRSSGTPDADRGWPARRNPQGIHPRTASRSVADGRRSDNFRR
jgi:hypothetical protein